MEEEDIAIVGAGCRFPGADNIDEFWKILLNGEDHVKEIPITRWNNDAFYDEDPNVSGKTYVRKAGLLNNHDRWDNRLFGMSDVEARQIDPQQRYVLECVHMALEDGGITRKQINGSNTGVIIGCMNNDYKAISNSSKSDIGSYNATSTSASVISARVSYVYNLQGTCLTLDTACSSALVAIHLASQSIQTGDCDMMICGGVSSILTPDTFVALCKARMLSPTGKCQSFCETADGYARGEGCGIIILKTLKSALKDGNKVWATIKIGSNQDGATAKPMTAPSAEQQLKLLREVYERHKFDPADIQYIEAHGTGTPRGDPTELDALGQFFLPTRKPSNPLITGSVKSNIGHTESAAGVAGLIKVLLMMKHGKYVPSLHVKDDKSNINKKIKLTECGLDIATSVKSWTRDQQGFRNACLNSFGFGGSNTHAILSQMKNMPITERNGGNGSLKMMIVSGLCQESLKLNLIQFQNDLNDFDGSICDISKTSLLKRDIFPYRTLLLSTNIDELKHEVKEKVTNINQTLPHKSHNIVFVYYGEGKTWNGFCQTLMQENEVFINIINEVDKHLEPLTGWKIGPHLLNNSNFKELRLNIFATFSIQVALTDVWKSIGIKPNKIIGQSIGEVAAGYAANILTLNEAVNIIYHISKTVSLKQKGIMVIIGNIIISEVKNICEEFGDKVSIAVYNSQTCCTLSGVEEVIRKVLKSLKENKSNDDIFVYDLNVECAYHSPLLKENADNIRIDIDRALAYQTTSDKITDGIIPMISTVTARTAESRELKSGTYWSENVFQPVLFMQSINSAVEKSTYNIFLEIGPRPVLQFLPSYIPNQSDKARVIPANSRNKYGYCLNETIKELFELGKDIDFKKLVSFQSEDISSIPRYKFNRTCQLIMPNSTKEYLSGFGMDFERNHMFVQSYNQRDFRLCIDQFSTPFVYDHFLSNKIIVPGATYVETGFYIGTQLMQTQVEKLKVAFKFNKTFSPSKNKQNILNVQIDKREIASVEFSVLNDDTTLASGKVSIENRKDTPSLDIDFLYALCPFYKNKEYCYSSLAKLKFEYGERLSLIEEAWLNEDGEKCLAKLKLPEGFTDERVTKTHFHPAIIDSVFQIFGIIEKESVESEGENFVIPIGVESVRLKSYFETVMYVYAEKIDETSTSTHFNSLLLSRSGEVIAEIDNFYTRIIQNYDLKIDESSLYETLWIETRDFDDSGIKKPAKLILFSDQPESNWLNQLKTHIDTDQIGDIGELNIYLKGNNFDESALLVYHVSKMSENVMLDSNNSFLEKAVSSTLQFKNIINLINDLKMKLQIIVVTENTQFCPNRSTFNYAGSELWGFIRSAFHEGVLGNIKIVDIDPDNFSLSTFDKLIARKYNDDIEFTISASVAYKPKLVAKQKIKKSKRLLTTSSFQEFSVYSSCSKELKDPFIMLNNKTACSPQNTQVNLESFAIHDQGLYPLISPENGKVHSNITGQSGGQIIVLEGTGKSDCNNRVSFLFPLIAKSTVHIPKECLLATKNDVNGMLIFINIAVQLSVNVPQHSQVAILRNLDKYDFGQEIFNTMMENRNCTANFLTLEELRKKVEPILADTLVISIQLHFKQWHLISRCFPKLKRMISLNIFTAKNFSCNMGILFPHIDVIILNTFDIFETEKIKGMMPLIRKHLFHIPSIPNGAINTFLVSLPMNSLDVKEAIQMESLRFFCCEASLFRKDSCYIVTGGSSGLGWEILKLIVKKGAGLTVNFSRRKPTSFLEKIDALAKTYSCNIISLQVDVSDFNSVQDAFQEIQSTYPNQSVKGIFHGAGVLSDSILANLNKEKIRDVMKPKIQGALNLHFASLNLPLDYFVLQSSIASVMGNPGQCNYAAANSFLDSFAHYRRSVGLPAQSINWGPLAVGMAVENDAMKSKIESKGFRSIDKEKLRSLFIEVMMNDSTNMVYSDIDWGKFLSIQTFAQQKMKYENFLNRKIGQRNKGYCKNFNLDDFLSLNEGSQINLITNILKDMIHDILVAEVDGLNDETSLTETGLDSMASMNLANAISDVFGFRIPVVTLLSEKTSLVILAKDIRLNIIDKDKHLNCKMKITELTDESEHGQLFQAETITFMQSDLLSRCKTNRKNPFDLRVIDMEMTGLMRTVEEWKDILKLVLKIHPDLRKRFVLSEDGVLSAEITPEEDLAIDLVEVNEKYFDYFGNQDVRNIDNFDIFESLPVSFRIAQRSHSTLIRIIIHAVVFDMQSLSLLCQAIDLAGPVAAKQMNITQEHKLVDMTDAIRDAISPRMQALKSYWMETLNCDIRPVTLGSRLERVDEAFCCISSVDISQDRVIAMKNYISRHGISVYEFIISLYQLFLYIGSRSKIITVGTAADMRFHVPELNQVLTRCTNYIPVIAHFDEASTFTDFIKENAARISQTTTHGAYPSSLILKHLRSDEARENIFRHFLSMNDMKNIRKLMNEGTYVKAKIKNIWHTTPSRETFLYIRYDLQNNWMQLEVGYNSSICGIHGQRMSKKMLELVDMALTNGNKIISDVRDELIRVDESNCNANDHRNKLSALTPCEISPSVKDVPTEYHGGSSRPNTVKDIDTIVTDNTRVRISGWKELSNNERICNDNKIADGRTDIKLAAQFLKQTVHGWDHKVNVILTSSDDRRYGTIQWGKERKLRKVYSREIHLSEVKDVSLRRTNGCSSLVLVTETRNLIFKSTNRQLAEEWYETIQTLKQYA